MTDIHSLAFSPWETFDSLTFHLFAFLLHTLNDLKE